MSQYEVFSGPYFPAFGPEKTPFLNIFHAVTILYLKCDQASGLCQKLELASELESDPQHIVNWRQELVVDFNIGKIQLASFD